MKDWRVVVVGLGYVGLPLAVALAKRFECWGLDIDAGRVAELREGKDRTGEIESGELAASSLQFTSRPDDCPPADFYIVTVPTPVDEQCKPDLRAVIAASRTVAGMIDSARKPIVVYESTVYPGVTEDICGPELERVSGMTCNHDFFLGYSPERINPGDREHTVDRITKVVAGQTPQTLDRIAELYSAVTIGGVFRAASIRTAEAAKVIENAQRDINIAFMNEITQIFARMDISIWDVLAAAGTKWNFLPFQPGLVGGHCIGVDPYYLSHRAIELGHEPKVILAGRSTNDGMAEWVAHSIHTHRGERTGSVLVMGLTFKEDVPDLRNSKVVDLIQAMRRFGNEVTVHDPAATPAEAEHEYGLTLDPGALTRSYDLVIMAVPHREYREMDTEALAGLIADGGTFADLKNARRSSRLPDTIDQWIL